jgi:hypothetical protein
VPRLHLRDAEDAGDDQPGALHRRLRCLPPRDGEHAAACGC